MTDLYCKIGVAEMPSVSVFAIILYNFPMFSCTFFVEFIVIFHKNDNYGAYGY